MPSNTLQVKEANRRLLRQIFWEREHATKTELAAASGLSVVTVNSIIRGMVSDGEVEELGQIPSEGGRPSMQYRYRNERRQAALVYAYYSNREKTILIQSFVVNMAGRKVWKRTAMAEQIHLKSFEEELDAAFSENENICCIYFGLPGELVEGVMTLNDFPELVGDKFLPHYVERYAVNVYVENDINAMTYGNYCGWESGQEVSVAGIYIPEHFLPGAGFVLNDGIYYGAGHLSGEIGRLTVPKDWLKLDYGDENAVAENIAAVLRILCMTLAPERFVIYGEFMTAGILDAVNAQLKEERKLFPGMAVCCQREIEPDYEKGLSGLALEIIRNERTGKRAEEKR